MKLHKVLEMAGAVRLWVMGDINNESDKLLKNIFLLKNLFVLYKYPPHVHLQSYQPINLRSHCSS